MAKEVFPSSIQCECGNESQFSEDKVRNMKRMKSVVTSARMT